MNSVAEAVILLFYAVPLAILGVVIYWAVRLGVRDGMRSAQRHGSDQP